MASRNKLIKLLNTKEFFHILVILHQGYCTSKDKYEGIKHVKIFITNFYAEAEVLVALAVEPETENFCWFAALRIVLNIKNVAYLVTKSLIG